MAYTLLESITWTPFPPSPPVCSEASADWCTRKTSVTWHPPPLPMYDNNQSTNHNPPFPRHWSNHQIKHFPPPKRNKHPPLPRLLPDSKGFGDPNLSPSLHGPHPLGWTKISFSFFHIDPPFQRQETGVWENTGLGTNETRLHRKKKEKKSQKQGKKTPPQKDED